MFRRVLTNNDTDCLSVGDSNAYSIAEPDRPWMDVIIDILRMKYLRFLRTF